MLFSGFLWDEANTWCMKLALIIHAKPLAHMFLSYYLTSNRGEGDEPVGWIGRGTRAPLQGAVDVVPLLGTIVVCWPTNIGGVDVVPLQGAIVVCYGGGGEIRGWRPSWGSGRGAIGGCHCSVLWLGASVTTNFGGVDVVPNGIQKNCLELLTDVTLFSTLITRKLVLLSGVYAGIIF